MFTISYKNIWLLVYVSTPHVYFYLCQISIVHSNAASPSHPSPQFTISAKVSTASRVSTCTVRKSTSRWIYWVHFWRTQTSWEGTSGYWLSISYGPLVSFLSGLRDIEILLRLKRIHRRIFENTASNDIWKLEKVFDTSNVVVPHAKWLHSMISAKCWTRRKDIKIRKCWI